MQPIPNVATPVLVKDGQRFVAQKAVSESYPDVKTGDVLKLNAIFYEVQAAVYSGTDSAGWFLLLIPTKGVFDDVTPEHIIEGISKKEAQEDESS